MRTRPLPHPHGPHLEGCCHNRKHSCLRGRTRAVRAHVLQSRHELVTDTRRGRSRGTPDRKSTRLNSSHANISYAVFCLKKKKIIPPNSLSIFTTNTTNKT